MKRETVREVMDVWLWSKCTSDTESQCCSPAPHRWKIVMRASPRNEIWKCSPIVRHNPSARKCDVCKFVMDVVPVLRKVKGCVS